MTKANGVAPTTARLFVTAALGAQRIDHRPGPNTARARGETIIIFGKTTVAESQTTMVEDETRTIMALEWIGFFTSGLRTRLRLRRIFLR